MRKYNACIFLLFFSQLNCGFVINSDFSITDAEHHDEANSILVENENTEEINDTQNRSADVLLPQNRKKWFDAEQKDYMKNEVLQDQSSNIPKSRNKEKWFDAEQKDYIKNNMSKDQSSNIPKSRNREKWFDAEQKDYMKNEVLQDQSSNIPKSRNREKWFDEEEKDYPKNEKLLDQSSNIPKSRNKEKWFDEEEEDYKKNKKLKKEAAGAISTFTAPLQQKQTKFKLTLAELITFHQQLYIIRNSRTVLQYGGAKKQIKK